MLEVYTEDDFLRRTVDVFIVDQRMGGSSAVMRLAPPDPEGVISRLEPTWEDVGVNEERPAPTLKLPQAAWEALAKAAGDALPPSAAVDRHLQDTIAVRDRLLVMAEREADRAR